MEKGLFFISKTVGLAVVMTVVYLIAAALFVSSDAASTAPSNAQMVLVGIFVASWVDVLVLAWIVHQTPESGFNFVVVLAVSFYGVHTFMGQIEALAFLTPLAETLGAGSIPAIEMPRSLILGLFLTGIPLAVIVVPLVAWAFGELRTESPKSLSAIIPEMTVRQWLAKGTATILTYELLYFGFGYFVAWQSEAVRTFYQGPEVPPNFLGQLEVVASETPLLFALQAGRALLWMGFVLPVVGMLRRRPVIGALATALFVSLPMNIGHIIPNPFMPAAVRGAHLVETASSNFIFGLILFWLFHRSHASVRDLFRARRSEGNARRKSPSPS